MTDRRIPDLKLAREGTQTAASPAPALAWTTPAGNPTASWTELRDDAGSTHRIDDGASAGAAWPFAPLAPRERRRIQIRAGLADGTVTGWSAPLEVRAGLLDPADWTADFICLANPDRIAQPALLRGELLLKDAPTDAVLHVTAIGAHVTSINGVRVGDHQMAPGWTSYDKRLVADTHDVTSLLTAGVNVVGASLGGGWRTEQYGFFGRGRRVYGDQPSYAAQLHVTYADGTQEVFTTGPRWHARGDGPIIDSSIYKGETVDLRHAIDGWDRAGASAEGWEPVAVEEVALVPQQKLSPPVRVTRELPVREVLTTPSGATVLDFGQNLVGRLRIQTDGPEGTVITVRHAEVLEHDEMGMRPLRGATQTDTFTLPGGPATLEPTFTFHGFRYAEVTGWLGELDPSAITAQVMHSDMRPTADFACSHPLVNRLHENVVWGMRGNFLSVPTDCPQRDERLGWTGDIQVFSPTAAILHDVDGFLADWLVDLRLEQDAHDGLVPFVIPDALADEVHATAAWGDAATIVPWTLWQRYGDLQVLADQYSSMRTWTDRLVALAGDDRLWEGSMQFGDWLDPDAPPDEPGASKVSRDIVATAYVFRSARIVSQTAALLGNDDDAVAYGRIAQEVASAFRDAYVTPAGRMMSDAPTAYALALGFDLVTDPQMRSALGARLAERVRATGYRISTGFVGTPLILEALSSTGHADAAGRLLLQTDNPSWLYTVSMGATTIWERWDSMLPDGSINPGEMTSFNHYALGAVAEWLHRSLAGLSFAEPGGRVLRIAPTPVAGIDWARTVQRTPHGEAKVEWRLESEQLTVDATVPAGARATVELPGRDPVEVGPGAHTFSCTAPAAVAPSGPYSLRTDLATLIDDPRAIAAIRDELGTFSEGYLAGFIGRTSWTEGSALADVLFGVPPHVLAALDARLTVL
ncbi:family 78 glycoside hydrolase catalytic domain [Demequina capsici]|uniref:alpha-L-rhamnosidase n=1 Tax=Demequina capsici TaxID=3075620 RepID=A0AA96FBB2_9MICO|nr:family 78 glycoside hydrolase catalytic domain [Demequina sp. PMTSA13]WNM26614.1 family 78 glycoside hydrolase catalytic domain [Demequina sp. PMTSA13]